MQITQRNGRKLNYEERILFSALRKDKDYLKTVWVCEKSCVALLGAWMTRKNSLGLGIRFILVGPLTFIKKAINAGWCTKLHAHFSSTIVD